MKALLFGILAATAVCADVSNPDIGYSVSLPAHWGQIKSKPIQDYFRDSTRVFRSQLSIVRYSISKADYPTPENWTQAQFIAYKLSVETSVFPYGAVTFYDSTLAAKIGAVWSPEAMSILYPADGDPTYVEYVRYCAVGDFGYEIYAIGDSTDMVKNVDFYAGIIATLKFTTPLTSLASPKAPRYLDGSARTYDAAGRHLMPEAAADRRGGRTVRLHRISGS